jgi:RimJ/RimL family protein N-acetyltransferase
MNLSPVTLTGSVVRLEPLDQRFLADLTAEAGDDQIWTFMRYGMVDNAEKMSLLIDDLLKYQTHGSDLPFVVVYQKSGRAIGMTRYLGIEPHNRAVEIGGTWYGAAYRRTAVNTECKFLLLQYAFEHLGYIRVQLKTDLRNERSQRAIERIGAVREGVLRDHMILPDGTVRSSVYYSILAREWPGVKQHLLNLLNRLEDQ